jgi:hypothetical protein
MAAAALIGVTPAMVAPDRITQIQVARIGGSANHSTADRAHRGTQSGIAGSGTDRGTTRGTQQGTTGRTVTRVGAATCDEQGRRKTHHYRRAHVWLHFFCETGNARYEDAVPAFGRATKNGGLLRV